MELWLPDKKYLPRRDLRNGRFHKGHKSFFTRERWEALPEETKAKMAANLIRTGSTTWNNGRKRVVFYIREDGTNVVFNSIVEAAKVTGANKICISNCCAGRVPTAGGLRWYYKDRR